MDFNLRLIIFALIILILPTVVTPQSDKVFDLSLTIFGNDSVDLKRFSVIEGFANLQTSDTGDYSIELASEDGETLFKTRFQLALKVHREVVSENGTIIGQEVTLSKVDSSLRLPFYPEVAKLEIYHFNKSIFEYKIKLCNSNKICEANIGENYLSCVDDCKSGSEDGYCDKVLDGVCDSDCTVKELDIDCTCGNKVCDARENEKLCPQDCKVKLPFWQRIWNFIRSVFT